MEHQAVAGRTCNPPGTVNGGGTFLDWLIVRVMYLMAEVTIRALVYG